ncbi:hypothetical protein CTEN210_13193 [Chaetoceros tenuissimus]|uniref:PTM/DIR17-like Tudor domain-containing protein n=1 Tax=Chaetoceros tenuissimus TaxID=426638 RepID=A0AAD3D2N6_9STRA|nr:hypothetical protein CTEN210_13180 [Chaetoceros tenuissimus]GFH56711.1 hypothetical protein CTEN210_13187 [Chaetoceros tenuissimus]GFH56717.1 hypothetical protein CTEN210_13193 [Chaetoceros tenuissimus]
MPKSNKRNKNKGKTKTRQVATINTVNRKRKAQDSIKACSPFAIRGKVKEFYSLVDTFAECRVALHGKEHTFLPTLSWGSSIHLLQNRIKDLENMEDRLAVFKKYLLAPEASSRMFGLDCNNQHYTLEMRMNIKNLERGHKAIFFLVSDVPEHSLLYRNILESCSIEVIELKAEDFSKVTNVSTVLAASMSTNIDVSKVKSVHDLVHFAVALAFKNRKKEDKQTQKRHKTRSLSSKESLPSNFIEYIKAYRNQGLNLINSKSTPEGYIGARVAKYFFNHDPELFFGSVTKYDRERGYWWIKYDDGDEEEFEKDQLIDGMNLRDQNANKEVVC